MSDKESITGGPTPKMHRMRMADGYDEMYRGGKTPTAEEKLRKENPGLQELWDQYQTMLKLVKPPAPDLTEKEKATDLLAQIRTRVKANHTPGMHIEADMEPKKKGTTLEDIRNRLSAGADEDELI